MNGIRHLALLAALALAACGDKDGDDTGSGGSGDDTSSAGGGSGDGGLWETPGAEGTASWVAAEALAACTAAWVADAHIARVEAFSSEEWSAYVFSASTPDEHCTWILSPLYGEEPIVTVDSTDFYYPGWSYEADDGVAGWAVDSDEAADIAGVDPSAGLFFSLTPSQHRAQTGWESRMDGVGDDVPVILIGEGLSSTLTLIDARSGDVIGTVKPLRACYPRRVLHRRPAVVSALLTAVLGAAVVYAAPPISFEVVERRGRAGLVMGTTGAAATASGLFLARRFVSENPPPSGLSLLGLTMAGIGAPTMLVGTVLQSESGLRGAQLTGASPTMGRLSAGLIGATSVGLGVALFADPDQQNPRVMDAILATGQLGSLVTGGLQLRQNRLAYDSTPESRFQVMPSRNGLVLMGTF